MNDSVWAVSYATTSRSTILSFCRTTGFSSLPVHFFFFFSYDFFVKLSINSHIVGFSSQKPYEVL